MKTRLLLSFPHNLTAEPVTYTLVKRYDLIPNILKADIDHNRQGSLLLEIEGEQANIEDAVMYLRGSGIDVQALKAAIVIDEERCVECSACVAACEIGALRCDEEFKLKFEADKCIECMLCIQACPLRAIRSIF
jgi:ferredoxin